MPTYLNISTEDVKSGARFRSRNGFTVVFYTQVISAFKVQPDEVSSHSDQKLPKNEKSLIFPPKDIEPVLTGKTEQIL